MVIHNKQDKIKVVVNIMRIKLINGNNISTENKILFIDKKLVTNEYKKKHFFL